RPELRDAEGREGIAEVPLLITVEVTVRLCAGRGGLAERLVVGVLDEYATLIGEESAAAAFAECEHPGPTRAVAGSHEAVGPRNRTRQNRATLVSPGEQIAVVAVLSCVRRHAAAEIEFLDLAEGVIAEVCRATAIVGDAPNSAVE